nr:chloroplast 30S ribosomal protein S16-2 [Passiflora auriculata]
MTVRIRLTRRGAKHRPFYKIVTIDSRAPRDSRWIQNLGFYDPLAAKDDPKRLRLKVDLVQYWLSVGAQPSDTVRGILLRAGVLKPPSMVVMGNKKGPNAEAVDTPESEVADTPESEVVDTSESEVVDTPESEAEKEEATAQ